MLGHRQDKSGQDASLALKSLCNPPVRIREYYKFKSTGKLEPRSYMAFDFCQLIYQRGGLWSMGQQKTPWRGLAYFWGCSVGKSPMAILAGNQPPPT